ncbi:hypothetical protein B0H21DRAFT_746392 [Amylocystis lapponica]|nr:hypothetical protein B0H21DRAFT_746392 [Amylocystis lapponica]
MASRANPLPNAFDENSSPLAVSAAASGRSIPGIAEIGRNSPVSVNRLPVELLTEIYLLVDVDTPECTDSLPIPIMRWLPLMSVCRYWYSIALAAPRLWGRIDLMKSIPFICLCLKRSANSLIDLIGPRPRSLATSPGRYRVDYPKLFSQQTISALTFYMPQLQELCVMSYASLRYGIYLSNGHIIPFIPADNLFPKLRSLFITGLSILSNSSMLSGLVELFLNNCLAGPATSVETILDILTNCPTLELLELRCSGPNPPNEPPEIDHIPSHIVSLPRLKSLTLRSISISISYLLAHLDIPVGTNVHLHSTDSLFSGVDHAVEPLAVLLPHDRSRMGNLADVDRIKVDATGIDAYAIFFWAGCAEGSWERLSFKWTHCGDTIDVFYPEILRKLAQVFAAAPVVQLDVSGSQDYVGEACWRGLFTRLPNLQFLAVRGWGDVRPLFKALLPSSSASVDGPVSGLKTLHISLLLFNDIVMDYYAVTENAAVRNDSVVEMVIECLGRRAAGGMRLAELRLDASSEHGLDDAALDSIRELVDDLRYRCE